MSKNDCSRSRHASHPGSSGALQQYLSMSPSRGAISIPEDPAPHTHETSASRTHHSISSQPFDRGLAISATSATSSHPQLISYASRTRRRWTSLSRQRGLVRHGVPCELGRSGDVVRGNMSTALPKKRLTITPFRILGP
ncbi:hypothetical protein TRAPUB_5725 [Trametes pubescens]|uniref:Uncharacterized protein n=1 Tax=Trametes pubescens TaxID=154538 RepID=A0A1M2V826_TRAPU|nr:hypothetical protein TRAPUB_5725 [Trametes pubescens]